MFGATTRANRNYLSCRGSRAQTSDTFDGVCCAQDFANQVYWWKDYTEACRREKCKKGLVATPEVGEWLAGLGHFRVEVVLRLAAWLDLSRAHGCPGEGGGAVAVDRRRLGAATSVESHFLVQWLPGPRAGFASVRTSCKSESRCLREAYPVLGVRYELSFAPQRAVKPRLSAIPGAKR